LMIHINVESILLCACLHAQHTPKSILYCIQEGNPKLIVIILHALH
jgi:hypothetical protein